VIADPEAFLASLAFELFHVAGTVLGQAS